jgi:hypothetical protein
MLRAGTRSFGLSDSTIVRHRSASHIGSAARASRSHLPRAARSVARSRRWFDRTPGQLELTPQPSLRPAEAAIVRNRSEADQRSGGAITPGIPIPKFRLEPSIAMVPRRIPRSRSHRRRLESRKFPDDPEFGMGPPHPCSHHLTPLESAAPRTLVRRAAPGNHRR